MKKIYLITKDFPVGNREKAFILPEYKVLSELYNITFIVTEYDSDKEITAENVICLKKHMSIIKKIVHMIIFLLHIESWKEFRQIINTRHKIPAQLYRCLMYGCYASAFYERLKKELKLSSETNAVFYFYWWDYKCLGLTMNKKKYPDIKIIARTHGYDLYNEREVFGRQYFKESMDLAMDRLVFISRYGYDYYLNTYHKLECKKYLLRRLGVYDYNPKLDYKKGTVFHIVSCSNVIPLKRVDLIIDGLKAIKDKNIKWIHFGDGSELSGIKDKAKKELGGNIAYTLKGYTEHEDVIRYYQTHEVHCFITTSETEGNPVSVQEALSFGIPLIATAVGDIPYMIEKNGILLPSTPSALQVTEAIKSMLEMDEESYLKYRKNSYQIFKRDYNADKNHAMFAEDLADL